jgi:hypothetical protein
MPSSKFKALGSKLALNRLTTQDTQFKPITKQEIKEQLKLMGKKAKGIELLKDTIF